MEHLSSLQAISAMVAPVVLITSGVLVANGLLATYSFGLEQIRVLKLRRLEGPRDEMLHEIDRQLATLLYRVRRLHITVLIIFGGTASLVLSVVSIAVAEMYRSQAFGVLALCFIFAGVVAMLNGLVIVTIAYRTDWRLLIPLGRGTVRLLPLCVVYISPAPAYDRYMITDTVRSATGRRAVRRRAQPTLDQAWDTALSDLPPAVRPLVRAYAENMRDGQEIRSQLGPALTTAGLRWHDVERLGRMLAFSGS